MFWSPIRLGLVILVLTALDAAFFLLGGSMCRLPARNPTTAILWSFCIHAAWLSVTVLFWGGIAAFLKERILGNGARKESLSLALSGLPVSAMLVVWVLMSRYVPLADYLFFRLKLSASALLGTLVVGPVFVSALLLGTRKAWIIRVLLVLAVLSIVLVHRIMFVRINVVMHDHMILAALMLSLLAAADLHPEKRPAANRGKAALFLSLLILLAFAAVQLLSLRSPDMRASLYDRSLWSAYLDHWAARISDTDNDGSGSLSVLRDCLEGHPGISPFAEEIVNDGIAQNCDGQDLSLEILDRFARRRAGRRAALPIEGLAGRSVCIVSSDAFRADHMETFVHEIPVLEEQREAFFRYKKAYSVGNGTRVSSVGLIAGRYVTTLKGYFGVNLGDSLLHHFKNRGYTSELITAKDRMDYGGRLTSLFDEKTFAEYESVNGFTSDWIMERVTKSNWLEKQKKHPRFLWIHLYDTHDPYFVKGEPESPVLNRYRQAIRQTARAARPFFERLFALPESERPILILTADHGEEFDDHGGRYHLNSLYDEQVHVPLWIYLPGQAGRVENLPVSHVDVAPSLLGVLGFHPMMTRYDGVNLFDSAAIAARGEPIWLTSVYNGYFLGWGIVSGDWKFVWDRGRNIREMYDLKQDPKEKVNRIESDEQRADDLRKQLIDLADILDYTQTAGLSWIPANLETLPSPQEIGK